MEYIIPIFMIAGFLFITFLSYYVPHLSENKQIETFQKFATATGYTYSRRGANYLTRRMKDEYRLFRGRRNGDLLHWFDIPHKEMKIVVLEYSYTTGTSVSKQTHFYHAVVVESSKLPRIRFFIRPEGIVHQIKPALGLGTRDIDFEMHPQFSDQYFLEGEDEQAIRSLFTPRLIQWFESLRYPYQIEAQPNGFMLSGRGELGIEEVERLKGYALAFHRELTQPTKEKKATVQWGREHDWD